MTDIIRIAQRLREAQDTLTPCPPVRELFAAGLPLEQQMTQAYEVFTERLARSEAITPA